LKQRRFEDTSPRLFECYLPLISARNRRDGRDMADLLGLRASRPCGGDSGQVGTPPRQPGPRHRETAQKTAGRNPPLIWCARRHLLTEGLWIGAELCALSGTNHIARQHRPRLASCRRPGAP
jgi:hypothetical protein